MAFIPDGFAIVPHVLTDADADCDRLSAVTNALATSQPGTRNLLAHDW